MTFQGFFGSKREVKQAIKSIRFSTFLATAVSLVRRRQVSGALHDKDSSKGQEGMNSLRMAFKTHQDIQDGAGGEAFLCKDNLFIVTEGIGGPHLAEKAGGQVCQVICDAFFKGLSEGRSPVDALVYALEEANNAMLHDNKQFGCNLAASVSVAFIRDKIMYFTHLGDSRIYCLHGGELNQLTKDHRAGEEGNARALTEALGIHGKPAIEIKQYALHRRELIYMTTEALTARVSNREILRLSSKTKDPEKLTARLIDLARRKGSSGSLTVGIMRVGIFSKKFRRIVLWYSVFFLLLLAVLGGYALQYREDEPKVERPPDQAQGDPPASENARQRERGAGDQTRRPRDSSPDRTKTMAGETGRQGRSASEDEIRAFIGEWKAAWETTAGPGADADRYISFYSHNFTSEGLDREAWKLDKAEKGKNKRWIRIEVRDLEILQSKEDDLTRVRFVQDYRSSNFSARSRKILVLKKEGKAWKIAGENSY